MQLNNVEPAYIEKYTKALSEAKAAKTEAALNKVFDCINCSCNFVHLHSRYFDLLIYTMLFSLLTTAMYQMNMMNY